MKLYNLAQEATSSRETRPGTFSLRCEKIFLGTHMNGNFRVFYAYRKITFRMIIGGAASA